MFFQLLVTTHEVSQTLYIVRNEVSDVAIVCIAVSFSTTCPDTDSLVFLVSPSTVAVLTADELGFRVEYVDVVHRTLHQIVVDVFFTHFLRHLSDTEVIVCEFQCTDYRFTPLVGWNITQLDEVFDTQTSNVVTCTWLCSILHHRFHSLFYVVVSEALDVSIGNYSITVCTVHDVRVTWARPFWNPTTFVVRVQKTFDHFVHLVWAQENQQWVQSTESIPK